MKRMTMIINKMAANDFVKSVLTLSSGVILAQAVSFFGMPILSRLYEPAQIGDYSLITANAGVLSAVVCLGMMTVFMIPKVDEEARGLCRLVMYSVLILNSISAVALLVLSPIWKLFNTEADYSVSCILLWGYIVFNCLQNVCYGYTNRLKRYKTMFWSPIIGAITNLALGVLFALIGILSTGYTLAHIIAFVIQCAFLMYNVNPFKSVCDPQYRALPLLKKYIDFPKYQLPANLVNSLAHRVPVAMLSSIFNNTVLGLYSMATRILSLPVTLLATPINRVYFREATEIYNKGENVGEFTFNILKANVKLALVPIVILIVFGEPLFALFLGEKWREAGTYAAVLGIYEMFSFFAGCLAGGWVIIGKQKTGLVMSCLNLLLYGIAYWASSAFFSDNAIIALITLSFAYTGYQIVAKGLFIKLAGGKLSEYVKFIIIYGLIPPLTAWVLRIVLWEVIL